MQNQISPVTSVAGERPTGPLKVAEIAEQLGVDPSTVYRAVKSGDLVAYRIGTGRGTVRVTPDAFAEYKAVITAAAVEVAA